MITCCLALSNNCLARRFSSNFRGPVLDKIDCRCWLLSPMAGLNLFNVTRQKVELKKDNNRRIYDHIESMANK